MIDFIRKHRNVLLLLTLLVTLAVSCLATQHRLVEAATTVALPVVQVTTSPASRLEDFRTRREETYLSDLSTLQALCDQTALSDQTREDAARQLQEMVARRESQLALEGALAQSGVYPCVAVITPGSVTVVTEKETLSSGESALVMTLAKAHAGVEPSGVRVMTAENAK